MKRIHFAFVLALLLPMFAAGCGGDSDEIEDLLDLVTDPPSRQTINPSRMGVNNFFNVSAFGPPSEQFFEIRDTLGLHFVRVLFAWTDDVQPTAADQPDYSFYDSIIAAIPSGVDVLVALAHTPSWMGDPAQWSQANPRMEWVERWLRPTVERYAGTPGIVGWEVFNEPDSVTVSSDAVLALEDPVNYLELLYFASTLLRSIDPGKIVVPAATRSIQQDFPGNLNYNKTLRDFGAEDLVDVWNVHFYGEQYERVLQSRGVKDFLRGLRLPIWITESGRQGPNNQLAYVETAWPFLREHVPAIDRIYYYEFGSVASPANSFGLRNTDSVFPVSDLYIYLRDR